MCGSRSTTALGTTQPLTRNHPVKDVNVNRLRIQSHQRVHERVYQWRGEQERDAPDLVGQSAKEGIGHQGE